MSASPSNPATRTGRNRIRRFAASLRATGFGLLFFAVAWSLAADLQHAVYVGLAASLVALLERRVARLEGANTRPRDAHRQAAARLLSLELAYDRSQSVLESLREGVVVVDGGGEIVLANPAARRALSRPEIDPVGRSLWEELPAELAQSAREAWTALREERDESAPEWPSVRRSSVPHGSSFFDLTAVPVTSAETGQDFGTVFLFVDATRNHEVQRLKDRFLSSMSHELRTPLTTICAYSEILCSMVPGESMEWPEFVAAIRDQGLKLDHLVDRMFDFLQLESGDAKFDIESVDGDGLVREVVRDFGPAAQARGIDLQFNSRPGRRTLQVDRRRFDQVCRHLLENAMKFTPEGGRVSVTCSQSDDDFVLRVDDSGPGVPKADRSKVFDKFTQLRDHLTDKPNGAGLGLATCRAIIGRCGGLIWCEDSPLGGAGLVVRLPSSCQERRSHLVGVDVG